MRRYSVLIAVLAVGVMAGQRVLVGAFSAGDLSGWTEKVFAGKTHYQLKTEQGIPILQANSQAGASGLVKEQIIDLSQTPFLNWRWRVVQAPAARDERSKAGDDYAARVYVIKSGGLAFWRTRAINYVWSVNQAQGQVWENAFAGKAAMMMAVRGQADKTGVWVTEKRNVRQDFKRLYGEDVRVIDAVAIMTDTDNAGGQAIAEYGDIYFSSD